jgi:hypothetical protein
VTQVDGVLVERWLLKVLCGLAAGAGFNNGTIPAQWKEALTGAPWPAGWGLYVPTPPGSQVLATEFYLETLVNPTAKEVKAAAYRFAGVHFSLLLGCPDNPAAAWGMYRPRYLIFRDSDAEKRIEFAWPCPTDRAIIYTRLGTSGVAPPQWDGWKE